jgi:CRISPR-associated protein Csh1
MIAEIVEFMRSIEPSGYATENIRPVAGLHILIKFDDTGNLPRDADGKPTKENFHTVVVPKKGIAHEDWSIVSRYEQLSGLVSMNKPVDSAKKIHSSSPYSLWFKKEALPEAEKRLADYLAASQQFKLKKDNEAKPLTALELEYTTAIQKYVTSSFIADLRASQAFSELSEKEYIKVYFAHIPDEYWRAAQNRYLAVKLVAEDSIVQNEYGDTVGLSGFLNTFGSKKPFLSHLTSTTDINNRISLEDARQLYLFERLLKAKTSDDRKKLPNPLPLFIDKSELNGSLIAVYSANKGSLSTNEILRETFAEKHTIDSGNYILLNWANTKDGLEVRDMDIVAAFRFVFDEPMRVHKFFHFGEERSLHHVLDFETDIMQKIFANGLVTYTKDKTYMRKYFDDIDAKYLAAVVYQNILRYRRAMYDYVYKFRRQAITAAMWYDILLSLMREYIRSDEELKNTYRIHDALNIFFSLNHHFDPTNSNFGGYFMPTLLPQLQEAITAVTTDSERHLQSDEEFAFAAGQIIYRLVDASAAGNKTHALLEPYITKIQPEIFKQALALGFTRYSHAFGVYGKGKGRLEQLFAEVMAFETKGIASMKDHLPLLLAGYFSDSLTYEPKKEKPPTTSTQASNGEAPATLPVA